MDIKSYEQMEIDFNEFYCTKIEPRLEEYEKIRKEGAIKIIVSRIGCFSFCIGFTLVYLHKFMSILLPIGFIFTGIAICFLIPLIYLTRNNSNNSRGETVIKTDFEYDLKKVLMNNFLQIFSKNADWYKGFRNSYWEKVNIYRKTNIFNSFPWALFDDNIHLDFRNVGINICEVNTSIFNKISLLLIFFTVAFVSGFGSVTCILVVILFSLFPFMIFATKIIFILLITYLIIKTVQYSSFKGIVVELSMNKNFTGHTFFLNKSFNAKKIIINRKKYENIELESVSFMNKYDVFSTDQTEARYILTTAMIDRLEHLKLAFNAKYIRGSFKDNKLILAINTGKDMFAMGNDFKESNLQTFRDLFNEIVSIMKIIDQLKLDEKTGL